MKYFKKGYIVEVKSKEQLDIALDILKKQYSFVFMESTIKRNEGHKSIGIHFRDSYSSNYTMGDITVYKSKIKMNLEGYNKIISFEDFITDHSINKLLIKLIDKRINQLS